MTAHTLEEGHSVIGPKIDIPLQYPGVPRDRWHRASGGCRQGDGCRKSWALDVGDWLFLRAAGSGGRAGVVVTKVRVRVRVQWFPYCSVKPWVSGCKPLIPILK